MVVSKFQVSYRADEKPYQKQEPCGDQNGMSKQGKSNNDQSEINGCKGYKK